MNVSLTPELDNVISYHKALRGIDVIRVLHGVRDIERIFDDDAADE